MGSLTTMMMNNSNNYNNGIAAIAQDVWKISNYIDCEAISKMKNAWLQYMSEDDYYECCDYKSSNGAYKTNIPVDFTNGLFLFTPDMAESFYSSLTEPKILIQQIGKECTIVVQIPLNNAMIIDWGDDSKIELYHFVDKTQTITHTYSDAGEHKVVVYGNNSYYNLDFSKVNGVYYALTEIYISGEFISPFPNATQLNKLFIIKEKS